MQLATLQGIFIFCARYKNITCFGVKINYSASWNVTILIFLGKSNGQKNIGEVTCDVNVVQSNVY